MRQADQQHPDQDQRHRADFHRRVGELLADPLVSASDKEALLAGSPPAYWLNHALGAEARIVSVGEAAPLYLWAWRRAVAGRPLFSYGPAARGPRGPRLSSYYRGVTDGSRDGGIGRQAAG